MRKSKIITFLLITAAINLISCVKKEDFNSLKQDYQQLKDSLNSVVPIKNEVVPISVDLDINNGFATASEGDTLSIGWSLIGEVTDDVVVTASSDGNYKVQVIFDSPSNGVLRVACPNPYTDGFINIMVNDGKGTTTVKVIKFVQRVLELPEGCEYRVSCEDQELKVNLNTNFGYELKLSSEDLSWISIPETKSGGIDSWSETLTIHILANSTLMPRIAVLSFIPKNGTASAYKEIKITQDPISTAIFTVGGVSFEMVYVEGGTFIMDDDFFGDDYYQIVNLSGYYIGKTEVTQELWEAVMNINRSKFKGAKLPVEQINWQDCMDFVLKLSEMSGTDFSLPTEAQWEFAARGGIKSQGYTYSGSNDCDLVAWTNSNSGGKTHIVAELAPNELGIYDMSGNVSEWCYDWLGYHVPNVLFFDDDFIECEGAILQDPITQRIQYDWPEIPEEEWDRCIRGGSYRQKASATTHRDKFYPMNRYERIGMRLAMPTTGPLPR